ncbi:MAG: hypothetical protein Q9186_004656 [Xanthomendoza sp. 1 TL-2023]
MRDERYLQELTWRYDKMGRTFKTKSLWSPCISSIEPENIQAVFGSRADQWGVQPLRLSAQSAFCGHGFITTDGPVWERSRALLQPSLNGKNAIDLAALERLLTAMMARFPPDGSTFDLQPMLFSLFLDNAILFLFGESVEAVSEDISTEREDFLNAFDHCMFGSAVRIALGPLKPLYRLVDSKWLTACDTTHRFVERYVQKALQYRWSHDKHGESEMASTGQTPHVLLCDMAKLTDDPLELRDGLLQALMAAQKTTAALISNVFFLLARHPAVWQTLREEVLLLGDSNVDQQSLQSLDYLSNILKESRVLSQTCLLFA